jgi:hypothetical protein
VDDRLARTGEPVDERGLPNVRVADDGDLVHFAKYDPPVMRKCYLTVSDN